MLREPVNQPAMVANPPTITAWISDFVILGRNGLISSGASVYQYRKTSINKSSLCQNVDGPVLKRCWRLRSSIRRPSFRPRLARAIRVSERPIASLRNNREYWRRNWKRRWLTKSVFKSKKKIYYCNIGCRISVSDNLLWRQIWFPRLFQMCFDRSPSNRRRNLILRSCNQEKLWLSDPDIRKPFAQSPIAIRLDRISIAASCPT
jgi:hypothetical protein